MKRASLGALLALLLGAAWLTGGPDAQTSRDFDPRADEALRKMSAALAGAKSFSFRSLTTMEEPIAPGQLAQFSRENRIVLQRPDRLYAEGRQDEDTLSLWYDGRAVTLLDKRANTSAVLKAPGGIDDMLAIAATRYGLTLPLADFLVSDPYKVLTADATTGRYVGLEDVAGTRCHHILFTQGALDWQLWIAASGAPVPRKFLIDYKLRPERPQFTAELSDWSLQPAVPDGEFTPNVPQDAKKVDIAALLAAGRGE